MSKKKKTLKQKKVNDLRKASPVSDISTGPATPTHSFTGIHASHTSAISAPKSAPQENLPAYTLHDLRKSITISGVLLIANTVIFVLVKNNIIPLRILGL